MDGTCPSTSLLPEIPQSTAASLDRANARGVVIFQGIVCEDPAQLRGSAWLQRGEIIPLNPEAFVNNTVDGYEPKGFNTIYPPGKQPVYPLGDPDPAEVN